jgi:inner membrane protein
MMKRSHAVIGAAAGVAVAHATGASMVAGGIVAGLAGLLPDVDHPHSAVGRLLPRWWHRLTPGHRGPTHSLAWCLAMAVIAYVANTAVNGAAAGSLLALAVLAGSLSHVLADGLTTAGVPLWWPFRRRRSVFLGALAFPTRSWPEALVVLGVVAGVGYWVAF